MPNSEKNKVPEKVTIAASKLPIDLRTAVRLFRAVLGLRMVDRATATAPHEELPWRTCVATPTLPNIDAKTIPLFVCLDLMGMV